METSITAIDAAGLDVASISFNEVPTWRGLSDEVLLETAWKDFVRLGLLSADEAVDARYEIRRS